MRRLNTYRNKTRMSLPVFVALIFLSVVGCNRNKPVSPNNVANTKIAGSNETPAIAAKAARDRGDAVFEERDDPKKLADAISLYEKAAALDHSADSWVRVARAYEMSGRIQKDNSEGKRDAAKDYATGLKAATAAMEAAFPGSTDKSKPAAERFAVFQKNQTELLYHYALLQWRWAQSQGTAVELSLRAEIMAAAKRTEDLEYKILGAAPYRLLGELYAELPVFAMGDLDTAKDYFQKAITLAPDALENRGAFARTYSKKADPASAKIFYEEIQNANPNQLKELAPENRIEQKRAKTQLEKL